MAGLGRRPYAKARENAGNFNTERVGNKDRPRGLPVEVKSLVDRGVRVIVPGYQSTIVCTPGRGRPTGPVDFGLVSLVRVKLAVE